MRRLLGLFNVFSRKTLLRLIVAFVVLVVPVLGFVELAEEVREGETLLVDEKILQSVNVLASPTLDTVMIILTQFGGVIGVTVLTIGIAALLWSRGMRRMAALL